MRVTVSLTRRRVRTDPAAPLSWTEQMVRYASDVLDVELPDGDYLAGISVAADGLMVLSLPFDFGETRFPFDVFNLDVLAAAGGAIVGDDGELWPDAYRSAPDPLP